MGLADNTDRLDAQAAFDGAQADRLGTERQLADALQALYSLTERDHAHLAGIRHDLPILAPSPADAQSWVDTAVRQNLDLQASQFAVGAAEEQLRQRKAGHAPTLDAVADYQRGDNDGIGFVNSGQSGLPRYSGPAEQSSIGLQLNIPLYSGGLTQAQVREGQQRLLQREHQRERLRRQVVQDTRNLHRAIHTDVAQIAARRQGILSSRSALEATELGYQLGSRNAVDVINAQRQLYARVRDYNNARYDYILDTLRLKRTAGTLSPADLQALTGFLDSGYDPQRDFLPEASSATTEAAGPQHIERQQP